MNFPGFIILTSFLSLVHGQYPINGSCPLMCKPFDLNITVDARPSNRFLQVSIPYFFENNTKCTYISAERIEGNLFRFQINMRIIETNLPKVIKGTANISNSGHTLNLYTELELPLEGQIIAVTPDYFVKIACHECGAFEKKGAGIYAWIYTKLQFPSCELLEEAISILVKCGIPREFLKIHDQTSCILC